MLLIFTLLTCIATDCVYVCTYFIYVSKRESPCQSGVMGPSGILDSLPGSATTLGPELGKVVVLFCASAAPGVFSIQIISCSGPGMHLCLGNISTTWYDDTKMLKWDLVKLETSARRAASLQQGQPLTLISSAEKGYSKLKVMLTCPHDVIQVAVSYPAAWISISYPNALLLYKHQYILSTHIFH